jgi:hypothetical protein
MFWIKFVHSAHTRTLAEYKYYFYIINNLTDQQLGGELKGRKGNYENPKNSIIAANNTELQTSVLTRKIDEYSHYNSATIMHHT